MALDYLIIRITSIFDPEIGGSVTHINELSSHMQGNIGSQILICPKYDNYDESLDSSYDFNIVRINSKFVKKGFPFEINLNLLYYSIMIVHFIKRKYACLDKRLQKKIIVHIHSIDLANYISFLFKLYRIKYPVVIMAHGSPNELWRKGLNVRMMCLFRYIMIYLFKPTYYMQVDDGQTDNIFLTFLDNIHVNYSIVHHAIDLNYYKPKYTKIKDFTILSIARMDAFKRVDITINVFYKFNKICPNSTLRLIGDGHDINYLKEFVNSLGISNKIYFLGYKSRDETRDEIQNASIVISTSPISNFNRSLIESAGCGIPSIIFSDEGNSGFFSNNHDAFLIPMNNEDMMVKRLVELYSNPDIIRKVGMNARETVEIFTSWSSRCQQELSVYDEMMKLKDLKSD